MKKPGVKMDNIECQNHKTLHLERPGWTSKMGIPQENSGMRIVYCIKMTITHQDV